MRGFNIAGCVVFNEDANKPFGGAIRIAISRDLLAPITAYIDSFSSAERGIWSIEVSWEGFGQIVGWRLVEFDADEDEIRDGLVKCFEMEGCIEESDFPSLEAH